MSEAVQSASPASTIVVTPSRMKSVRPMCLAASANIATANTESSPAVQRRLSPMSQTSHLWCVAV